MTRFVNACQQLAKQMQVNPKTSKEAAQMDIGRAWAVQLIDNLRNGDETPGLLSAGVMLSGRNQDPAVMAGFLDELSQAIKDGIR